MIRNYLDLPHKLEPVVRYAIILVYCVDYSERGTFYLFIAYIRVAQKGVPDNILNL